MSKKQKYYTVWNGRNTGVFNSWEECEKQVLGFEGAQFKSFPTKEEAEQAFEHSAEEYIVKTNNRHTDLQIRELPDPKTIAPFVYPSLAVDAACSHNPGPVEYRGVDPNTGKQIFHVGPFQNGTNNIGEFLALVHALAYMEKKGINYPIYSDSRNAILWIRQGKCKTKLKEDSQNAPLFDLIRRAERWLNTHNVRNYTILQWNTEEWGEIPADFGRK